MHLTETCDDGQPHLITQVITTPTTTPDCVMGPTIQDDLATQDLLPSIHLLDSGYVDAELLVTAFVLDWEAQQARGPQGQARVKWTPGRDVSGDSVVRIRLDRATCRACPIRQACTWAKDPPRQLTVWPRAHHEAIQGARQRQETPEFTAQYARWTGVEGTHAQGIRRCGLRPRLTALPLPPCG